MIISFRDWLNLLRTERHLSLPEFGAALGYSAEGVRRYAGRARHASSAFARALSGYLELPPDRAAELQHFVCGARSDIAHEVPDWIVELAQSRRAKRARDLCLFR